MKVKHLWTTGSYDGMMTGVGRLEDGRPVFLDATDCWGGHQKKERWQLLENLLDELLDDEESENIWDRIERAHEDEMYEYAKRRFVVTELTQEQFEELAHKKTWDFHGVKPQPGPYSELSDDLTSRSTIPPKQRSWIT